MTITERLERLRNEMHLSWGELCETLEISRTMLYYLRSGDRQPSRKLDRQIRDQEIKLRLRKASPLDPPEWIVREKESEYLLQATTAKKLQAARQKLVRIRTSIDNLLKEIQ